jgi:class 3 adenylate cyclase/tetratricopeptide (TPR) repeat protein
MLLIARLSGGYLSGNARNTLRLVAICPTCGEGNPDSARFCNACGADIGAAARREVRKTVTVLFADVTGSTALGERLDPESLRHVMARYFESATACIERHGGVVEKFIGDAVMAVFGVPVVHEDDALRALRAAVDLRNALETLNGELARDYGVSLRLRTGINTGEVVTGTAERLATGDAVNVAARLEQEAQPEEILIGEQTFRLSRGAIEAKPVEPLPLKGKADPVRAYRLVRVIEDAPAFDRRLDAPLIGRREELARMRAAFDRTVSERGCRLLTVLGPPGIGKSRMARELAVALADEATVLSGRCLPYGEGITYWPLVEIFREAGAEEELSDALSAAMPEDIFWSVRKAFERRAREQPVALVVEDIHWAEPTLLDLLDHLVSWTRDAPLLVLCLARPDLIDGRPTWGGSPNAETLTLEPLSEAESDELVDKLLDASELAAAVRARVCEVAGGNPLFVEQLLAMLVEGGDPQHVPPSIQALLAARLDSLPDEEREILERASVVGLEFEWEALGELAPGRGRPPGAQLAALIRKELIRPHEAIEDTFFFRHMLIRDAAYERIPKETRAELHERFADWLEGRGEEFDEIIGYHLEQAHRCLTELGRSGERSAALAERAAERLEASGRRAYARADSQAAASLLERAASLYRVDDLRRLRLLPVLGRALRMQGQPERADEVLSEAVERGLLAGDPAVAADARLSLFDLRVQRAAKTEVGREEMLREIEAAVEVFRERGDETGLARALLLRGQYRFWGGEAAAALPDIELAAELARKVGNRAEEGECVQYICAAMRVGPTPADEALRRLDKIGSGAAVSARLELAVLGARAHLVAIQGDFDAARDLAERGRALAEEHGLEDSHAMFTTAFVEHLAGDAATAEGALRAVCEGYEQREEFGFLSSAGPHLAEAILAQGRNEEALAVLDRWPASRLTLPEDADGQAQWRRVRAKVLGRMGELEEAERLGREAVAIASGTADILDLQAESLAALGEVLQLAGRVEESRAALEEAVGLYEAKGHVVGAERVRALLAGRPIEA